MELYVVQVNSLLLHFVLLDTQGWHKLKLFLKYPNIQTLFKNI